MNAEFVTVGKPAKKKQLMPFSMQGEEFCSVFICFRPFFLLAVKTGNSRKQQILQLIRINPFKT